MKDSGMEWVGAIPSHWDVRPFYSFAAEVDSPNVGLKERNLLSLSYGQLVRKDMDRLEGLTPASFEGYNIIEANDIVFRLTDLQNDQRSLRSARAQERGIITSAYVTVRPQSSPRFFEYLMRSYDTSKVFYGIGGGIRQSMKFADLKRLPVVVPPIEEMEAISSHLDRATSRIDTLVAKKTRFIKLLREKRQALITHAVTKGLNAGVPMKDSGVEWLGELPAHWRTTRLPYFIDGANAGEVIDKSHWHHGIETLYTCAKESMTSSFKGFPNGKRTGVNDLLLTRNGTPYIHDPVVGSIYSNVVQRVSIGKSMEKKFAQLALSAASQSIISYGVSIESLNFSMWSSLWIPMPSLEEQRAIVAHLDRATTRIDTLIAKTERSIELLREHRTALITAAVTGKIDLRNAA